MLTLPVARHPASALPSDLTDTLLNTWILGWDAQRLGRGLGGLWDAPIFFPYRHTLAFSENLLGLAPFAAPVYWTSGNPLLAYNAAFLASFVVAGVGMYLLAFELTGSGGAALVAGAFYAFGPFKLAQIAHIQTIATGWMPIALWALHRYFATGARRWTAILAAAWILQALSNSYLAYFMALPIAIVAADGLLRAPNLRRALRDLGVAAAAVAIAMLPVAAAYLAARIQYHQTRDVAEIAALSADVRSYLVGKSSIGVWRWLPTAVVVDPEKELFPGIVAILLAILGLVRGERLARLYGWIAVAAFVLSLGPIVHVWGRAAIAHAPYSWLLAVVPGMNGMRVPARFAIVVVAALAVMAAYGMRAILTRVAPRARPAVVAVCLLAIVAEGWAVPLPVEPYPARGHADDRAVGSWLKDRPPGGVLHLPLTTLNYVELNYQYATLFTGRPIVNGFSGYNAPLHDFLADSSSPLYDFDRFAATVDMLRAIGVRAVVVHGDDYPRSGRDPVEAARTIDAIRRSGQVAGEMRVGRTAAFELAGPTALVLANVVQFPVDSSHFTLTASEAPDRLAALGDRNLDSRWIAGLGGQNGSSWIAARFDAPIDAARLELRLARRSLSDYPRVLRIESTMSDGTVRTLYEGSPYAQLANALLADPDYPPLTIEFPANRTATLTIRQTAATRRAWSVHELRIWRR